MSRDDDKFEYIVLIPNKGFYDLENIPDEELKRMAEEVQKAIEYLSGLDSAVSDEDFRRYEKKFNDEKNRVADNIKTRLAKRLLVEPSVKISSPKWTVVICVPEHHIKQKVGAIYYEEVSFTTYVLARMIDDQDVIDAILLHLQEMGVHVKGTGD